MPFFRRGGGRSSASATSAASASAGSKDDANSTWRSSTHCASSEVASAVSKTSSRRSSRTGALMVTMSRPPRPATTVVSSARSDDKSTKDPSQKAKSKKKKERITRTTKPGSSTAKNKKKNQGKSSKAAASSSLVAATPATDRSRSRDGNEQVQEGQTPSRSSTPVRRNRRDDNNVHSVERDAPPAARSASSPPPSTPTSSAANTGNPLTSSSPESTTTSTVISDSSEDSHGNTTVSSITQTMALDPARMAMDYPELAASLKHHPPMIERTLKCPAGAIGCQIDDSSTGPIIDDVLASSSMEGLLFPGDRILAVDSLDVRGLKCGRVTEIMSERRHQEREIKVLSIINIGCKGNHNEPPKEEEYRNRGMERLRARKKKISTSAVSSVPAMPTPKPTPNKDGKSQPQPLHRRSIVAPAGKLGLVLRNTKDGPAIHTIKPTSPLANEIFVGDRIVRVNSTDTTTLKAKELTKLMAGNSIKTREIVVLSAVDGAKNGKAENEVQGKPTKSTPSSTSNPTPKALATDTNKSSHASASITSATASLSTRSDTKFCGATDSEAAEQPSVSVDHSLPPFRSTPTRRKEGESFQQYLVRRRRDLSDIRARKECHDEPTCTDVKSRSSEENRSSIPSFSTMKTSAEKFVQEGNQDAVIHQYERLIGCLEMRYSDGCQVESDSDEITKVQQAGVQEEIIVLCDVLRELYRAKGEKAKSVKCLRKKISTQRSLLKLKMEMM